MNIKQIIPAPGWSVVECKIYNQNGTGEIVKYESSPLVGWALVEGDGKTDVQALVCHDELDGHYKVLTWQEWREKHASCILAPGQELKAYEKEYMEDQVRDWRVMAKRALDEQAQKGGQS